MADFESYDRKADAAEPVGLSDDQKKAHAEALSKFHVSASFFAKQREREVSDLKFIDFDEQWEPGVKASRAGNVAVNGMPPTPARPAITINQLRGPCQQVAAQRRAARLALAFAPKGNGANQDVAEAFEDIARAIQAESRASIARNWAADRAEKAGMGWYRIDTEYSLEEPTDPAAWNDQDIVYRRVLNQASVYPDPFAQEPDFSDGRCWFVTQDIPWAQYKREFPKSKLAGVSEGELTAIGDTKPDFVFDGDVDGEAGKTIRVAEYWEVVETARNFVLLDDGSGAYDDEIPEGRKARSGPEARSRKRHDRKLLWSKINAVEYLEGPVEWNGLYTPLIPTIGEESNVGGERRWIGIVRPGREAAVAYNVMRSAQIETIATATKSPWIGYMETIEPYLKWWENANTRNFPMLPIKAVRGPDGALLPPPQRNVAEPAIQAITIAAQAAKDDIHTTTGVPPVSLGQLDPHERSGKAIQALQQTSEQGSGGYLDNLVNISMAYEGKVLRDLIPRIYDRPGRIVPAVGLDEQRRMVMLGVPFTYGEDKQPVAVPGWQPGAPIPEEAEYIDLSSGVFSVQPVAGKDYPTRRKEASDAIGNVMQVVPPEMAAAIAPAWLEEQDYAGAKKIAEIAKKSLPPNLAAAYQDEGGKPGIPPEVQAQMQQMEQALKQAMSVIEGEQVKQQAETERTMAKTQSDAQTKMQQANIDAQVTIRKAQIDAETRIKVAQINAQAGLTEASIKAGLEQTGHQIAREEQLIGHDHELNVQARDHEHERDVAQQQAEQAERDRELSSTEAMLGRQHESEMATKQAQQPDSGA